MKQKDKMVIYQVFPRWFGNSTYPLVKNGSITENGVGKFSAFNPTALARIKELGTSHIWYTGVIEHATQTDYTAYQIHKDHSDVVKGKAGSPYAIKDYYDIDPDLADRVPNRMKEFEALVKRTHDAGMKVIIDFVPNHVAREYHSDARLSYVEDLGQHDNTSKAFDINNNFYYIPGQPLQLHFGDNQEDFEYSEFPAKVTGNNHFDASPGKNDWYETVKLNYGVDYVNGGICHFNPIPNTWTKMLDILLFWAGKGIDGFRCDMAEMVPVEFWNWVIPKVKEKHDVCFIAEVYNPNEYRNYIFNGHFDYLYDKVGLYDTVRAVMCDQAPATNISGCWQALEGIQSHMLNFLENHDEQRVASYFFAGDP
ncbi:MAG: alpha-amylase family glycosyl hydrolase, partial [Parabacteroides gordonii]|uniref:alpha-amylase family glycosyl hydrolase n=1 Tax=Parabacteroides gordonii TaxID=574930 RepID=UPI003A85155C